VLPFASFEAKCTLICSFVRSGANTSTDSITPVPDRPHHFTPVFSFAYFHRLLWAICPSITLRAMPMAAGKKLDFVVRTVITLFEARTESAGTTGADVSENFALRSGERVSPAGEEFLSVLTKDIGHFQPMLGHDCGSLSPVVSMGLMRSVSKGLRIACNRWLDTCKYRAVVRMSECPSITWIVRRSAPASSICVAQACRNRCGWARRLMPARCAALRNT
jgi:hypothetical protein